MNNNTKENLSWSAFHASQVTTQKEPDVSVLMPLFREDSKSIAMIKHGMDVVKTAVSCINKDQCPVIAFDQPLYTLAKQVQWNWKDEYGENKFTIMMGALHIEMAALKTLGNWLEDSGWCNLLVNAKVASSGAAQSFLYASHVSKTRCAHQIAAAVLFILMKKAYNEYKIYNEAPEAFETWRSQKENKYPQFRFWSIVRQLQFTVLLFVRSIRSADFRLYKESINELLPWFFGLDHINYARWLSVHMCDIMQLDQTNSDTFAHFDRGDFVVSKTKRSFSPIGIDHAHEQNNKCVKGDGGAIGLTEDSTQLLRWMVCGSEVARCVTEFECVLPFNLEKSNSQDRNHHEQVERMQKRFYEHITNLIKAFEEANNPFLEESTDLIVLDTRNITDERAIYVVNNIQRIGKEQYNSFVSERLKNKQKSIFDPIKLNKFRVFKSTPNKSNATKVEITTLKKSCHLFSRLYISCQIRDGNLDEFFKHENTSFPPALSKTGELRSGNKADLLTCFESVYPSFDGVLSVDCVILDGAAVVNFIKPNGSLTFLEYAEKNFLPYIQQLLSQVSRLDIVWDVYLSNSLKAASREKRGSGIRRRVQSDSRLPNNWQSFLRLNENKKELFEFLSAQVVAMSTEKTIVSTRNSVAISNNNHAISGLSPSNHEEADTRVFLHAGDASVQNLKQVAIRTVDTDIAAIAIGMFSQLEVQELWIIFGVGKNLRNIPIHSVVNVLGDAKSCCMPLFHAFTGCDHVSFFGGRGKKICWNTWNQYEELTTTLQSISSCPSNETLKETFKTIERYVVLLYDRTSTEQLVNGARKQLFAQKGRSLDSIPPSADALFQHLLPATYQGVFVWGQALQKNQSLPNPSEWGWKIQEKKYHANWITLPEASSICKELVRCGCDKVKGCMGRCKCKKMSLRCTALCKCNGDCEML